MASMTKSTQKRRARERAQDLSPGTAAPRPSPTTGPVDEALFEKVAASARAAGEAVDAGTWLYNGDTLSIKLVVGDAHTPRRLLVAAFQQGVVFQVEGDRQLTRRVGPWVDSLPTA